MSFSNAASNPICVVMVQFKWIGDIGEFVSHILIDKIRIILNFYTFMFISGLDNSMSLFERSFKSNFLAIIQFIDITCICDFCNNKMFYTKCAFGEFCITYPNRQN
jgi:hypothetical protein